MIVGLLAMLFMLVSAYITLARFDRKTMRQIGRGKEIEKIVDGLNDVVRAQLAPDSSAGMVTGENYAEIPGYREGRYLASLEPVRDPQSDTFPADYRYPAVTSLTGSSAYNETIDALMRDYNYDGSSASVVPGDKNNPDTMGNARNPRMDAVGDGLPDSSFADLELVIELANALGGKSVQVNGLNPNNIAHSLPDYPAWRHFDEQARYEAAARIVSHGGMVLVGSSDETGWNQQFIRGMFNWIRHPDERQYLDLEQDLQGVEDALQGMSVDGGSIEPLLRRRGGLLMGTSGDESLPSALRELQDSFPETFDPRYEDRSPRLKEDSWQRFNLALENDWHAWRQASCLDPNAFNTFFYNHGVGTDPRESYVPRRLITTVSYSDELAREQTGLLGNQPLDLYNDVPRGIDPGQLKFDLNRLKRAFKGVYYQPGAGDQVVKELFAYYHEMLADYVWEGKLHYEPGEPEEIALGGTDEAANAVKRRRQAFMLAVNTLAFTAPRRADGYVDVVEYTDAGDSTAAFLPAQWPRIYYGYGPQPFITQVIAYNKLDTGGIGGEEEGDIALAIELYNPNDPTGLPDSQALYLPQFALSVNDSYDGTTATEEAGLRPLDEGHVMVDSGTWNEQMAGRQFRTISVHEGGNSFFDTVVDGKIDLETSYIDTQSRSIMVKLWRRGSLGHWHLVDEQEVDIGSKTELETWYVNVFRDCSAVPYMGKCDPTVDRWARWRMVMSYPKSSKYCQDNDSGTSAPDSDRINALGNETLGNESYGYTPSPTTFGPCIPLYTMNANPNVQGPVIHGAERPPSFPTVGFMLFVPRYSHMRIPIGAVPRRVPMGKMLYDAWDNTDGDGRLYNFSSDPFNSKPTPADFGHMPVFHNKQTVDNTSDFSNSVTGRVPWGLLVFDYFTTLNVDGPDGLPGSGDEEIDPYRVAGRININMAPWYVLAGLPVIGPKEGVPGADLPLTTTASPAFRSASSGVLTGTDSVGVLRFSPPGLYYDTETGTGWWRLGPYLGQAAAAYRDRVQYTTSAPWMFLELQYAHKRNPSQTGNEAYRPIIYGPFDKINYGGGIRGGGSLGGMRGFLTLGELANVAGFDSRVLSGAGSTSSFDFFKAVSLLALLDTHFLTTRSNTFTVYTTLTDRENPQASLRSQITVDRSKLLPKLLWQDINDNGVWNPESGVGGDRYTLIEYNGEPEIIGQREIGYFNARYDD